MAGSAAAEAPLAVLCGGCPSLLQVSGAAISVSTPTGARDTLCASDATIAHIEHTEFTLGEGPGHQAYSTGRPVLIPDLAAHPAVNWPFLAAQLADEPISAIFAFPLQYGQLRTGTLTLYRTTSGGLTPDQLRMALQIVDLATALLIGPPDGQDGYGPDDWWSLPQARTRVHQATGMVMAEFAIPADQALARLRGHAFATGRLVDQVAADLVERRLYPRELAR
ncbi:hypothetical protein VV02_21710 [Luteipulveratus mongoliensis]|uniref:ANTAR domain-containing protein n=1 Tax=Luteipulveratus mongoliensis TaxID=571913 RepID=A0A0K1JR31_9MICO|nr:hypothetical protein VV02_21710 [Luteipulveratus mongoliensis]